MKPHSSMRIAVQAMMMVFLVAGSAFGLTNITDTSSPYNAVRTTGSTTARPLDLRFCCGAATAPSMSIFQDI